MKKTLSLFLAILIVLAVPVNALSSGGILDGNSINANLLKKIEFTYQSSSESSATCYYTDDYFSKTSYEYNLQLSTMSMSLAFSAFGAGYADYSNSDANAVELLTKIGIPEENIQSNDWYKVKPTNDSFGIIAGNKIINVNGENYTLVAIACRGGGYESEWASNFTIGLEGQHKGFAEAKTIAIDFIKTYIADQNISGKVKIWLTGYSRAAAVANLVGGAIDDGVVLSENITYELDDVYAYCFEAPAGALTESLEGTSRYDNIFNIINPNDPVPFVAPFSLGFSRYGVDIYLPTAESHPEEYEALKEKMLEFYLQFDGITTYSVDNFQMKRLGLENWLPGGEPINFIVDDTKNNYTQSVFLSNYINILSEDFIVTRENYVANYEEEIREVCSVIFGCTSEQQQIMIQSLISQAQNNWGDFVLSYLWHAGLNPFGNEEDALIIVSGWLKTAISDAGITDYDEAMIDSAGVALADLMLSLIISHPNYFSTVVMNIESLGEAHYPELCFAWLQSLDPNYTADAEATLNSNSYRIIYVNGDADINIYKKDGTLVASYVNQEIFHQDNGYNFGTDDGQFYVILPIDSEYAVNISNETDSTVDYIVKEYNSSIGITRAVEFKNESFLANEYLVGVIPMYEEREIINGAPNGSTASYTLVKSDGTTSEADNDVSRDSLFVIKASTSNNDFGTVSGNGTYKYGETVTLYATSNKGCNFVGWYENEKLITSDAVYTFKAYSAHNFVAAFESTNLTPKDGSGISVVDGVVLGLWDKLTVETARELFENSETLTANTGEYIGTGDEFTYFGKTYKIVILGDIDGNGIIDTTDYIQIKNAFSGIVTLDADALIAADVTGDGEITSSDYIQIKSHFLGLYNIHQNKVA